MSTLAGVSRQLDVPDRYGELKAKSRSIAAEVWVQTKLGGVICYAMYGYPGSGGVEHGSGYAVDFMVGYPGHHDDGQAIRDYVWAHRARIGLHWVIWEQHITTVNSGVPRLMADRGDPNANHFNHVHAFWDNGPLSYAAKPPRYPVRVGDKMGAIDADGRLVIPARFGYLSDFKDGAAILIENDRYGFVDWTGRVVAAPKYHGAEPFSGGFAWVATHEDADGWKSWTAIDRTGRELFAPRVYKEVFGFADGEGGARAGLGVRADPEESHGRRA